MAQVVHDPFHRAMKAHLDELIEKAVDDLSNGSATAMNSGPDGYGENMTTAERYAAQVSQIRTLRNMLALCAQVAEEIVRPAKVDIQER